MSQTFRSRHSAWITLTTILSLATGFIPLLINFSWLYLSLLVLCLLPIADMLLFTHYTISQAHLTIKMGIITGYLLRKQIKIEDIIEIKTTYSLLSKDSYAWSAQRLLIIYKGTKSIYLSPSHQERFVACLRHANPVIRFT